MKKFDMQRQDLAPELCVYSMPAFYFCQDFLYLLTRSNQTQSLGVIIYFVGAKESL